MFFINNVFCATAFNQTKLYILYQPKVVYLFKRGKQLDHLKYKFYKGGVKM